MTVTDSMSVFFANMYYTNKGSLSFIIESYVPNRIMLKIYYLFIRYNEITKIEELAETHKKELVETCNTTGIKFNNQTLTQACRILHTLNEINANT